ncbi:MAG: hypothetical protein M0C28_42295 [Candidatus Moduliflexus flocculans]|nr:hypothetical protein [Candidatus Moduliflexus flocculans]
MTDIYEALYQHRRQAGHAEGGAGGRTARAAARSSSCPSTTENALYYNDWVEGNIAKVDKATGGKVGYIHIPEHGRRRPERVRQAFLSPAAQESPDRRRPRQRRRQRLADGHRPAASGRWSWSRWPATSAARPIPARPSSGRRSACCDEFSASDGDIFPYRFKTLKLGQGHRQADLGRRRRHPRHPAASRRRRAQQARVRALQPGRQGLDHRGRRASSPTSSSTTTRPGSSPGSTTSSTRASRSSSKS